MELVQLGTTGVNIPEIGLGTYLYKGGPESLRQALGDGPVLVDTAELYLTEAVVGEAVRDRRDDTFLSSKVGGHHLGYRDVIAACDRTLSTLGTDRIDLYQVHWRNHDFPLAETVAAMEDLVDAGKVRFIGLSNFGVADIREAQALTGRHRFVSNQVQYSLVNRNPEGSYDPNFTAGADDKDVLSYCRQEGITLIAWAPLGMGRLLDDGPDSDRAAKAVAAIATATGRTPGQVALNWCTSHPGVVAIPKANSTLRMTENLGASGWRLSGDQLAELDEASEAYLSTPPMPERLSIFLCKWAAAIEASGEQQ